MNVPFTPDPSFADTPGPAGYMCEQTRSLSDPLSCSKLWEFTPKSLDDEDFGGSSQSWPMSRYNENSVNAQQLTWSSSASFLPPITFPYHPNEDLFESLYLDLFPQHPSRPIDDAPAQMPKHLQRVKSSKVMDADVSMASTPHETSANARQHAVRMANSGAPILGEAHRNQSVSKRRLPF